MHPDILTYEGVKPMLSWQGAVDALVRGHGFPPPHQGDLLLGPDDALLLNRAAYVAGLGYVVKAETVFPGNADKGLASIQGRVLLFSPVSGTPRAVIESRLVTQYKTAADSLLAATLLARPDSRALVIAGAGPISACLAEAYAALFPRLETISIWARRPERARALVRQLRELGPALEAAPDLEAAVRSADIVSAATSARDPIIAGEWVRSGTHVDLVGAFTPDMREADDALMARGRIFVDYRDTTVGTGELMQPVASGAISEDAVLGDLYDMVAGKIKFRESQDDITVFKNGGGAHLDLMIADYIANTIESRQPT